MKNQMSNSIVVLPAKEIMERLDFLTQAVIAIVKSKDSGLKSHTEEKLLSKRETAEMLGCSLSTVDNLRRRGELKKVNVGRSVRFNLADIKNYIHNNG